MAQPNITATITALRDIGPDIRSFIVQPSVADYRFKPGEHLLAALPGSPTRVYSFANSPLDGERFELVVKKIGVLTNKLFTLGVGDTILISSPLPNRLSQGLTGSGPAAFIAGGVGIVPFLSIIRDGLRRGVDNPMTLFYSSKTASEIICRAEFEDLAERYPQLKLVFTLTRDHPGGWRGEQGRIDAAMISRHVRDPIQVRWSICGPALMVLATRKILLDLGVPREQIFL